MKPQKPNGYVLIVFAVVITLMIFMVGAARSSDDPVKSPQDKPVKIITSLNGADLFRAHCAPCHGENGKGHGPVAPALSVQVADLTTIAQRNGGKFPAERVRKIIAGDEVFAAHGSREMPIWGPIFHQIDNDRDYGFIRLNNLTEHLRSIQQK
jgi:mono/diheme cytochrome c family protein